MDGSHVGGLGNEVKEMLFAKHWPITESGEQRVNPDVEIADWRAVCGRTARTVRREGRALAFPYPYRLPKGSEGDFHKY